MEQGVTTVLNSFPGCLIVLSLVCKCHEKGCWSVLKSFSKRFAYVGHIRRVAIYVEPTRPKPESSEEEKVGFLVQELREVPEVVETGEVNAMAFPEIVVTAEVANKKGKENGEEGAEVKEVSPPRYSKLIL